ncbi:MAG: YidC/Oxa1 family membrane protein insertase [Butyricicoccaceae bacterium]
MGYICGVIFVRPLGIILSFIFSLVQNYGYSIILFTLIVKLILLPFQYKNKQGMKKMQEINVEAQKIQKKYARAKDKTRMNEEIQALYERENYNPMSSCLLTFITLPIMMALYYAVRKPMTYMMALSDNTISAIAEAIGTTYNTSAVNGQIELARMVHENWDKVSSFASEGLVNIDFNFFGLDLSSVPSLTHPDAMWIFPILAGVTSLGSSLIMQKMQGNTDAMANNPTMKTTMMLMPLMSVWFCFSLPSAMAVYWIVNNIFTCVQEYAMTKRIRGKIEKADAAAAEQAAAVKEAKRVEQQKHAQEQAEQARARQAQLEASRKKNKKKKG